MTDKFVKEILRISKKYMPKLFDSIHAIISAIQRKKLKNITNIAKIEKRRFMDEIKLRNVTETNSWKCKITLEYNEESKEYENICTRY